ncbi:MAG: hypothetical protein ABJC09_15100 [Terriglobia bacterium]
MQAYATPSALSGTIVKKTLSPGRFLLVLASTACLLAAILLACVTFTDPSRYLFGSPVPQIRPNVTRKKIDLFQQYSAQRKVTGLMMGSSRSALLLPAEIDRATGLRFFNAAVDDPTTDQFLALYRLFRRIQGAPPKMLVIGYETPLLSQNSPVYPDMAASYELNAELDPHLIRLWHYVKLYARSLRTQTILDLHTSVTNWMSPHPPVSVYFPDGHAEGRNRFGEATNVNRRARLGEGLETLLDRYREFSGMSQERLARLRSLFEEASADGVRILIWFTPLHPALRAAIDRLPGVPEKERQSREAVQALAREFGGKVLDLSDPDSFDGDPTRWLDAVHVNPVDSRREMARIMAAVQN